MNELAKMKPDELATLIKTNSELLLRRRAVKASLEEWCKFVLEPVGQSPARHHVALINALEKVNSGEYKRLLVMMPPGSAKSSYVPQMFPPYWFIHHPHSNVLAASNTQRLAEKFSRATRLLIEQHASMLGYGPNEQQQNILNWATTNQCEYISVGSEGSVLGHRADLIICDDPYRSRQEAQSDIVRDSIWSWYSSDLMSRLKPDGRIIVVMTRFHTDDLCGRLMEMEPDDWHVIRFPAICEDPENDPLGRKIGELLWPEYQTAQFYEQKRRAAGELEFASNYQQRPLPTSGNIFDSRMLEAHMLSIPPDDITATCRAWDLAAKVDGGDYTVGLKLARREDGRFIILDVVRFRGDPSLVESEIKRMAMMDGKSTRIALSQDPGQAGLSQIQYLTRQLSGYSVTSERETGQKTVRCMPVASQVNTGNVSMLLNTAWNRTFLSELSTYPSSRHDDQIDALSRAFGVLSVTQRPSQSLRLDYMAR